MATMIWHIGIVSDDSFYNDNATFKMSNFCTVEMRRSIFPSVFVINMNTYNNATNVCLHYNSLSKI